MKLTDEAVEAAARSVHHERYPWVVWENLKPESREYYRNEVRGPIEAALPHLTDDGATPFELETERISWHRKEGYEAGLSARAATPAIDRDALAELIETTTREHLWDKVPGSADEDFEFEPIAPKVADAVLAYLRGEAQ